MDIENLLIIENNINDSVTIDINENDMNCIKSIQILCKINNKLENIYDSVCNVISLINNIKYVLNLIQNDFLNINSKLHRSQ